MAYNVLLSVTAADRVGLVSAMTARLFDLGANLGTTTFNGVRDAAEFSAICELPPDVDMDTLQSQLSGLPELAGATVHVRRFDRGAETTAEGAVIHHIECSGRDQPGIVARLTEIFIDYGANIVTLNADRVLSGAGDSYTIRFTVEIPSGRADACLATLANTAGAMRMIFSFSKVGG